MASPGAGFQCSALTAAAPQDARAVYFYARLRPPLPEPRTTGRLEATRARGPRYFYDAGPGVRGTCGQKSACTALACRAGNVPGALGASPVIACRSQRRVYFGVPNEAGNGNLGAAVKFTRLLISLGLTRGYTAGRAARALAQIDFMLIASDLGGARAAEESRLRAVVFTTCRVCF